MDCFYSGMKKSLTALAFGTLGLGIAEFVMMGILPDVAKDLHISIPQAGHFISAYALGVCVGAPGMVLVARTRPLKHILLGLMVIYICSVEVPKNLSIAEIFYVEKKKARRLGRTSVFYGSICFDCFTSVSITS